MAGGRVLGVALPRALADIPLFFFFYFRGRREFKQTPLFPFEPALLLVLLAKHGGRDRKGIENICFPRISAQMSEIQSVGVCSHCRRIDSMAQILRLFCSEHSGAAKASRIPASGCWKPQAQGSASPWHPSFSPQFGAGSDTITAQYGAILQALALLLDIDSFRLFPKASPCVQRSARVAGGLLTYSVLD